MYEYLLWRTVDESDHAIHVLANKLRLALPSQSQMGSGETAPAVILDPGLTV